MNEQWLSVRATTQIRKVFICSFSSSLSSLRNSHCPTTSHIWITVKYNQVLHHSILPEQLDKLQQRVMQTINILILFLSRAYLSEGMFQSSKVFMKAEKEPSKETVHYLTSFFLLIQEAVKFPHHFTHYNNLFLWWHAKPWDWWVTLWPGTLARVDIVCFSLESIIFWNTQCPMYGAKGLFPAPLFLLPLLKDNQLYQAWKGFSWNSHFWTASKWKRMTFCLSTSGLYWANWASKDLHLCLEAYHGLPQNNVFSFCL